MRSQTIRRSRAPSVAHGPPNLGIAGGSHQRVGEDADGDSARLEGGHHRQAVNALGASGHHPLAVPNRLRRCLACHVGRLLGDIAGTDHAEQVDARQGR